MAADANPFYNPRLSRRDVNGDGYVLRQRCGFSVINALNSYGTQTLSLLASQMNLNNASAWQMRLPPLKAAPQAYTDVGRQRRRQHSRRSMP